MKRILSFPLFILTLLSVILLTGCQSDIEKLDKTCARLETISKMTDDCRKMAKELKPVTESVQKQIQDFEESAPDIHKQAEFTDRLSVCLKAYLEISTGTCGRELDKSLLMQ